MNFLTSDNPEDNYKELHEYAAKLNFEYGWHYSTRGRPYYNIKKRKKVKQALMFDNCIFIKKHTMKVYLLSGYLNIRIETDFGRYNVHKLHAKWLLSVCHYNGYTNVNNLRHISTRTNTAYCISKYVQSDFTYIILLSNNKHPNGYAYISDVKNENKVITELNVPKDVIQGHIANVRCTQLNIARNRPKHTNL